MVAAPRETSAGAACAGCAAPRAGMASGSPSWQPTSPAGLRSTPGRSFPTGPTCSPGLPIAAERRKRWSLNHLWPTPASSCIVWHAAAVVHALARPCRLEDLAQDFPSLSLERRGQGCWLCCMTRGMLSGVELRRVFSRADETPALLTWEFHDLLFHARERESRAAGTTGRSGGSYRFTGWSRRPAPRAAPPPAR